MVITMSLRAPVKAATPLTKDYKALSSVRTLIVIYEYSFNFQKLFRITYMYAYSCGTSRFNFLKNLQKL